jgi:hypothetical protein
MQEEAMDLVKEDIILTIVLAQEESDLVVLDEVMS